MKKHIKILKKKLQSYNPRLKEECGVFGISNAKDASALTALGLHALQHRGQEGCGIVTFDGEKYYSEKRFGLVGDNFNKEKVLNNLKGNYAIGHNRYSTTGNNILRNIQPFFADTNAGGIGVAHNGNLTNSIALRNKLVEDGAIFYTTSDTETIVQLIAKSKRPKTIDKVIDAIFQIQGGYALVMLTQNSLIGVRDPYGIRPLVIGKLGNSYVLASETCAFDIIGAKFVREVENGEIVLIENNELKSIKPFPAKKVRPCVFEYIYFSRPDSLIGGKTAYEHRKNIGRELAKENDTDADIVVPVPDSGNAAAIGFAQELIESVDNPDKDQLEASQIIQENHKNLMLLMDSAAEYASLIADNFKLSKSDIRFVDLIHDIEDSVKKVSKDEKTELTYGKISSSLEFRVNLNWISA